MEVGCLPPFHCNGDGGDGYTDPHISHSCFPDQGQVFFRPHCPFHVRLWNAWISNEHSSYTNPRWPLALGEAPSPQHTFGLNASGRTRSTRVYYSHHDSFVFGDLYRRSEASSVVLPQDPKARWYRCQRYWGWSYFDAPSSKREG